MHHELACDDFDPALVESWLRARSVARGVPQPVRDSGGLRVDTALPNERCRYVFAAPCDGLRALGRAIREPGIYLKLFGTAEALGSALPAGWTMEPLAYFMTTDRSGGPARLPAGYRIETRVVGATAQVVICSGDGHLAASGFAAEYAGVFVYDRIVTDALHRRSGLGRAVMSALAETRRSHMAQQALVATEAGRGLYASMGWSVQSPFATACIAETVSQ